LKGYNVKSLDGKLDRNITPEKILGKVINQAGTLFNKIVLDFLGRLDDKFKRDTVGESFFYFRNCFVKVTKEAITVHKYEELDGYIWDRQIINRDFHLSTENSVFKTFTNNICRGNKDRINSLESVIGYLLHGYKNPANARAIIFTDERIGEGAAGGNGKGIVGKAISHIVISARPDGQNFTFDRFMFQTVVPGTTVVEFTDARENFPFQKLFSIITDSMTIEKKYETAQIVPFEYSPKILISTNHAIKGVDASTLRRQFIVEFSDYYNENHFPIDDFGKNFFDGWTPEEWNEFDNYMIQCTQKHLRDGLVGYNRKNWDRKVLIESTSEEFVEFMQDVDANKWHNKKQLYEKFIKVYPDLKNIYQKTFTQWIKTYAKLKGFKCEEKKSGAERSFRLLKIDSKK
jgi:hypothetical protein